MDNYKRLMCVKGLILSLDEQLYKLYQGKDLTKEVENRVVDEYYKAIKEQLKDE